MASSRDTFGPSSDPGAIDGLPRPHPVLPDEERSHRDISGTNQIGMERIVAMLADEQQARIRTVFRAGMSTRGTRLGGEIRIHLDRHTAMAQGLVGNHGVQRGRGPLALTSVGFPLLLARLFAMLAPSALADVSQLLQSNQTVGVPGDDAFGDDVIGVLRSPVSLVR